MKKNIHHRDAEFLARQSRNRRFGISHAKHVLSTAEGTQRPQRKLLSEPGALRALAGKSPSPRCFVLSYDSRLARKFQSIVTEFAEIGEFFSQELFTPCAPCLSGEYFFIGHLRVSWTRFYNLFPFIIRYWCPCDGTEKDLSTL
jgi:hypothetical protein